MAVYQKDCEWYTSCEQPREIVQLSVLMCSYLLDLESHPRWVDTDKLLQKPVLATHAQARVMQRHV